MTFKVGDKVRRNLAWVEFADWPHGQEVMTVTEYDCGSVKMEGNQFFWSADKFELVECVADKFVPEGLHPGCGKFEPVYEPVTPPKAILTAWTGEEIGPFYVRISSRTNLSAVDTLNRLWFNDPVGQKLNQIEIEYKESPDMTDDQLVQKIMTELESMDLVTKVLISWKSRPNGIAWDRE